LGRYFFDSSALAKRYHPETGSAEVERLFAESGREIRISRLSFVENSVGVCDESPGRISHRGRSGDATRAALADIANGEIEVSSVTAGHFTAAEQLIARHGYKHRLRTLDALQLAVAVEFLSEGLLDKFVVADKVLAEVAALEGLSVLNPETP
jgi:predicted nucleic acid-binding protein